MTAQSGPGTSDGSQKSSEGVSRRHALGLFGTAGAGAAVTPVLGAGTAQAAPAEAPAFHLTADSTGAPPVQGLHLTFGADPSTRMTVSWITDRPVRRPAVRYGTLEHGFGSRADARTVTYEDGTSGRTVYVHHASLNRLAPGTDYLYLATH